MIQTDNPIRTMVDLAHGLGMTIDEFMATRSTTGVEFSWRQDFAVEKPCRFFLAKQMIRDSDESWMAEERRRAAAGAMEDLRDSEGLTDAPIAFFGPFAVDSERFYLAVGQSDTQE